MDFRRHPNRPGVDIYDPIEAVRFALFTPETVRPTATPFDDFHFPIDSAVAIETDAVTIPNLASLIVLTQDGTMVTETADLADRSLPHDDYLINVSSAPMKIYLAVSGPLALEHADASVRLVFDRERTVAVGARSYHDSPVGTITVTDDVDDVMAAVSLLGSGLETLSAERSFPTLRGHPPLIERGERFDVPDGVERPETDVRLVVPRDREFVYPSASLAYYLGAELVPGDVPRLVAEGFETDLTHPDGYHAAVNDTLRQLFVLDCVTRTEGLYRIDLHEREQIEPLVDLDFAALYDAPLSERLAAYLSVPFETVAPFLPEWRVGVDVEPTCGTVEYLPYLADDLALLRVPEQDPGDVAPMSEAEVEFWRNAPASDGVLVRGNDDADAGSPSFDEDVFPVESFPDAIEHAWAGPGIPLETNKLSSTALQRRADRTPSEDRITIRVVCNDEQMAAENVVADFYGVRDLLQFDIEVEEDLSTDELAASLATDAEFFHYIGHVDANGFKCRDGYLDAREVDEVGVTAFLLNACQSFEQGRALIEGGSQGGVVTLWNVGDSRATQFGKHLARLLNAGFSLRSALNAVQERRRHTTQYVTLGDGGMTLVQSESAFPHRLRVERQRNGFRVTFGAYLTPVFDVGSIGNFHWDSADQHYLPSREMVSVHLRDDELSECLDSEQMLVEVEGELYWSNELTVNDI